jgi:hypothetical protein
MRKLIHLYLIMVLLFMSCVKFEKEEPIDFNAFQPLGVGLYWIYQVSDETTLGTGESIQLTYRVKDLVSYFYLDAERDTVFVFERFMIQDDQQVELLGNYSLALKKNFLIHNNENKITALLKLPPRIGDEWDAMIFNASSKDLFKIIEVGEYKLLNNNFDESVKVEQENEDDKITFLDKRYVVFSKNIGMIEQYSQKVKYCSRNDCLGKQVVEFSKKLHFQYISHGKI